MDWTRGLAAGTCLLALAVVAAGGQTSNEPPVVQPHKTGSNRAAPKTAASTKQADLLVSCNLACTFTFDGESGGRMDADGSVKVKTGAGQHLVVATAESSTDRVVKEVSLELAHQTLLRVDLVAVREARLQAEQKQKPQPPAPQPPAIMPAQRELRVPGLDPTITAQNSDEQRCMAGDAASCDAVATKYRNGEGSLASKARAAHFYATACQMKMADACNHLGDLYAMETKEMEKARAAYTAAVTLYQPECDQGKVVSCAYMGNIYNYSGSGIKDLEKVRHSYQQACDIAVSWCSDVAAMYESGSGGPKDPARAHELYQKMCRAGNSSYCSK